MSALDIGRATPAEDGRIKLKLGKREMDFRVSVLPRCGARRSSCVARQGHLQLDMTKLGFDAAPLADFKWAIDQPWGMVLVTARPAPQDDTL